MHTATYGDFPGYEVLIADDASKFIVQDTEGRPNPSGKWDAADAVDFRFVQMVGPAYVFESVVVHRHPDDGENDCERFTLGPNDDDVLIDDLPDDVREMVMREMGVVLGSPVAALDFRDPENSRVADVSTSTEGEDDTEPLDPERAVEIDIDGGADGD
jgi:hypothetical protein